MYYIFCERFYLFPECYVIISFIRVFFYFAKVKISLFKENSYLIFTKLQQLKIFSSNLNAQSKKQVIFTNFLLPKKRLFSRQITMCNPRIKYFYDFYVGMYFYFLQKPRTALLEQLSRILPSDSDTLPDQLILANTCDRQVLFSILFIN